MKAPGLKPTLAAAAFLLGAVAVVGEPAGGPRVVLDARELAAIVEAEVDHVTAGELAGWILEGRTDYRLLDVRDESSYTRYHIPTAEHATVASLPDYPILRNEKIVLYSDGGIHAAQAWFLLQATGFRASYTLLGGLDAWMDEVLFPATPADPTSRARAEFDRAAEISRHFGGSPRGAAAETVVAPTELPRVEAPPTSPPVTARKKKRKEGC